MANIGYARCSTLAQDFTAQRQALAALSVPADRVYLDKGLTGTSRARAGLDQALAAVREGDTLAVTGFYRLARSVPDALDILSQLSARGVRFALGGSVYDWNDPFARMFLQILAVIAKFEANLIRQRTREGMDIARQTASSAASSPSLKPAQDREIRRMHDSGDYNVAEIAALFSVSRPTVYRSLDARPSFPRSPSTPGLSPARHVRRAADPPPLTRRTGMELSARSMVMPCAQIRPTRHPGLRSSGRWPDVSRQGTAAARPRLLGVTWPAVGGHGACGMRFLMTDLRQSESDSSLGLRWGPLAARTGQPGCTVSV